MFPRPTEDFEMEPPDNELEVQGERPDTKSIEWLMRCLDHPNIAELVDESDLTELGSRVVEEYEIDLESLSDWKEQSEAALKMAKQVREEKSEPWPGCANVKYPLMTTAAIHFASRAYPEIIQGTRVVKCEIIGEDPQNIKTGIAERISQHMSWQLLKEMDGWEEETDKLLVILPIIGTVFTKIYFDPIEKRNIRTLILPDDFVVNYKAKSLEGARRATHVYELYENDIYERVKSGIWLDVDLQLGSSSADYPGETDVPHVFLEQHRYWDFDKDGYAEPYVVTVHKDSNRVVRVTARFDAAGIFFRGSTVSRIKPIHYFTKFGFFPNPDGGFYDLGYGQLLEPLNATINTLLNQLLDAGTMANTGGGFIASGIKMKAGEISFKPNEWKPIQATGAALKDGIVPLPIKEPSMVLFQLLGLMIDAGKDIANLSEALSGNMPTQDIPATTMLAIVEQGLKIYSALFKRVYRSLTNEYRKLFRLNSLYLDPQVQFRVLDVPVEVFQQDYDMQSFDVYPVADPNISTDIQRMMKARALAELGPRPGLNQVEVTARLVDALRIPNANKVLVPADQIPEPPPDPRVVEALETSKRESVRLQMDIFKFQFEVEKIIADIEGVRAKAMLDIAKAEAEEVGPQVEQYKHQMEMLSTAAKHKVELLKTMIQAGARNAAQGQGQSGGLPGLEAPAGDGGSFQIPGGM